MRVTYMRVYWVLEMFFVELHVDRLGFALLRSAPHYPSKRTRLDVSLVVTSPHVGERGAMKGDVRHRSRPPTES